MILFIILESEDSYEDLESIHDLKSWKILLASITSVFRLSCPIYIAVSQDLHVLCFRIYFFLFISLCILWPASITTTTCGARELRITFKLLKYCCCYIVVFVSKLIKVTQ